MSFSTLRLFSTIVTVEDLELHQMDVEAAFAHEEYIRNIKKSRQPLSQMRCLRWHGEYTAYDTTHPSLRDNF